MMTVYTYAMKPGKTVSAPCQQSLLTVQTCPVIDQPWTPLPPMDRCQRALLMATPHDYPPPLSLPNIPPRYNMEAQRILLYCQVMLPLESWCCSKWSLLSLYRPQLYAAAHNLTTYRESYPTLHAKNDFPYAKSATPNGVHNPGTYHSVCGGTM